jgi:hypothetical protein
MVERLLFAEECWAELEAGSYHRDSSALRFQVLAQKIWLLQPRYVHS